MKTVSQVHNCCMRETVEQRTAFNIIMMLSVEHIQIDYIFRRNIQGKVPLRALQLEMDLRA